MTDQQSPSQRMSALGVVQAGADILTRPARRFDLPAERELALGTLWQLHAAMDRIATAHDFSGKGLGLAAPQLGLDRAAAVVRPASFDAEPIELLNPRIVDTSPEMDEQFEGCLSFFDVRGRVPRPLTITVETIDMDGATTQTLYERSLARLIAHEIDHLDGLLYSSRMLPGVEPISVEKYRGTGRAWAY